MTYIDVEIETDVPLPSRAAKYPLHRLGVGHSFFVPAGDIFTKKLILSRIYSTAKIHRGEKYFTCKTYPNGVRCWRRS